MRTWTLGKWRFSYLPWQSLFFRSRMNGRILKDGLGLASERSWLIRYYLISGEIGRTKSDTVANGKFGCGLIKMLIKPSTDIGDNWKRAILTIITVFMCNCTFDNGGFIQATPRNLWISLDCQFIWSLIMNYIGFMLTFLTSHFPLPTSHCCYNDFEKFSKFILILTN